MCGIAGEFRFDGIAVARQTLERMSAAVSYRGPDDDGIFQQGPLGLAHRRLSIIDLSAAAHQPMVDADSGHALVFNGTIYNYPALRTELIGLGHSFRSHGDTEVILKAYRQWGDACVERLKGMFAFAIWDPHTQSLFIARDRFGIKPFYFSHDQDTFRFASNTRALLLHGDVDTRINPVALHHHLTLHAVVPAPLTLFEGLAKLPPAHCGRVHANGKLELRRYWSLDATRPETALPDDEWQHAIHAALNQAAEKRLKIADVPVGVLLSGGLDSSLIVALLCQAGATDLQTFSIGFEDTPEEAGSEFAYSDQVVARYGTRHHKIQIPNEDVIARLPEAVDQMAEPMVSQDAIGFYLLAEQVAKEVKVVQSGQGADEVFGGYFWYPKMDATHGDAVSRFRQHYFDRDHEEYLQTIGMPYWGEDYTADLVARRLTEANADSYLDQVFRFDVTTLIVDDPVKRVDNMTMAWGLESRVPFLDQDLVETAARMPPSLKLADGGKGILKRIARGILPDAVIDRKKGYFPVPALKFVRGEFRDFMADILNASACRNRGLFQRDYVDRLLADPEKHHTRILGSKLWHLALLELWLQRHID